MLSNPMLTLRLFIGLILTFVFCLCFSGCVSKMHEGVEEATVPPPAIYPSAPAGYGSLTAAPVSENVTVASPVSAHPAPFELGDNEELVTHLIVSGESLSSIAGKYKSSISRIMSANGMSDTLIYAGKPIQVPVTKTPRVSIINREGLSNSMSSYQSPAPSKPGQSQLVPGVPALSRQSAAAPEEPSTTVNPASTSYPRQTVPVAPLGAFPTPSF